MCRYPLCKIFAGWLALAATAPADIVWSGNMYQRAYHDIPAIDFNLDGTNDFTFSEVVKDNPIATYWEIWIQPADGQIVIDNIFGFSIPNGVPLPASTTIHSSLNNSDYHGKVKKASCLRMVRWKEALITAAFLEMVIWESPLM